MPSVKAVSYRTLHLFIWVNIIPKNKARHVYICYEDTLGLICVFVSHICHDLIANKLTKHFVHKCLCVTVLRLQHFLQESDGSKIFFPLHLRYVSIKDKIYQDGKQFLGRSGHTWSFNRSILPVICTVHSSLWIFIQTTIVPSMTLSSLSDGSTSKYFLKNIKLENKYCLVLHPSPLLPKYVTTAICKS